MQFSPSLQHHYCCFWAGSFLNAPRKKMTHCWNGIPLKGCHFSLHCDFNLYLHSSKLCGGEGSWNTNLAMWGTQLLHNLKIFACTTWNQLSLTFSGDFFLVDTLISLKNIWHFSELIDDQLMSAYSSTNCVAFGMWCVIFCISLFLWLSY